MPVPTEVSNMSLSGEVSPLMSPGKDHAAIVLEGYLTKQGSRSKSFWHDRYFVLTADGTLAYYSKKGEEKPKAVFVLNELLDCEISELYADRQNKNQMLYCVKITWSVMSSSGTEDGCIAGIANGPFSDNDSVLSAPTVIMEGGQEEGVDGDASSTQDPKRKRSIFRKTNKHAQVHKRSTSAVQTLDNNINIRGSTSQDAGEKLKRGKSPPPFVLKTPPKQPKDKLRDKKELKDKKETKDKSNSAQKSSTHQQQHQPVIQAVPPSIDGESLTMLTAKRPPALALETTPSIDELEIPQIPSMVEVKEHCPPFDDPHSAAQVLTVRASNNNNHHHHQNQFRHSSASKQQLDSEELVYLRSQFLATEKEKKRKAKHKVAEGAKFAVAAGAAVGVAIVTVGIGLVAGVIALSVGAAAGASGTATGVVWKKKREGEIVIGTADYEKMRRWKACLDASLNSGIIRKSKWGQLFVGDGNKRKMLIFPKGNDPLNRSIEYSGLSTVDAPKSPRDGTGGLFFENAAAAKWKPLEGGWTSFLGTGPQGLRIFREEERIPEGGRRSMFFRGLSVDGRPCPPMKSHVVLNATPLDAFLCLMSQGQLPDSSGLQSPGALTPNSGQRSSFRIIESIDDNTDVIHLVCNPLYLFPSWTTPRDFVLYRYWRLEEDGSFIVCYESVQHKDCPSYPGYCRGEMHQVFTVAPHKKSQRRKGGAAAAKDQLQECLMTAVVQVDPKGWVPIAPLSFLTNQGYGDAFAVAALQQLLDIRDAIDQDRFIPVSLDDGSATTTALDQKKLANLATNIPRCDSMRSEDGFQDLVNYDYTFANRETLPPGNSPTGLASKPLPLRTDEWAEPDANSFRVRGKTYKEDRLKINAGSSIGRLIAVDVVQVDAPIYTGMTAHPTERLQLALKNEKARKSKGLESDVPPFLFVVNIVLPGPPFYHACFYYAIDDMSAIDGTDGTPSSRLAKEFIFGDSDSFRAKTFKLIPQIVQGNFIVRRAVGSTPAIMGKKLRQLYVKTPRSFEVVLDCGSSPVATGVIRLSLGYAKTLVVDMAFLLEGDEEDHLPEKLMGCARIRELDFSNPMRKVEQPPTTTTTTTTTTAGRKSPVPASSS